MEEREVPRLIRELASSPELMEVMRTYLRIPKRASPLYRMCEPPVPQHLIDAVLCTPSNVSSELTNRKGEFTQFFEGRLSEPVPQHLIENTTTGNDGAWPVFSTSSWFGCVLICFLRTCGKRQGAAPPVAMNVVGNSGKCCASGHNLPAT